MRNWLRSLLTPELAISVIIYLLFLNYVIQYFSKAGVITTQAKPKSAPQQIWDSMVSLLTLSSIAHIFVTVSTVSASIFILTNKRHWIKPAHIRQKMRVSVASVAARFRDSVCFNEENLWPLVSGDGGYLGVKGSPSPEEESNTNSSQDSLKEVLQSAKMVKKKEKTNLRDFLLSARPFVTTTASTQRSSQDTQAAGEMLRQKLIALDHRDEKQGSERVVAREGADGNNTKNDVDWGEYGMEKRDSGIVMMSQQPNQFGDITHEKCFLEGILNSLSNGKEEELLHSARSSARVEAYSPFNRPLLTAETTPILSSERLRDPSDHQMTRQQPDKHTSNCIQDSADQTRTNKLHNYNDALTFNDESCSAKYNETLNKRSEIRRQIDLCLNQLDESLLSQCCDSFVSQNSSFMKTPKMEKLFPDCTKGQIQQMHESKPPSEQLIEELCAKWGEGGGFTPIQVFQHYLKAHTQSRGDVLTIASSNRPDKTTAECRIPNCSDDFTDVRTCSVASRKVLHPTSESTPPSCGTSTSSSGEREGEDGSPFTYRIHNQQTARFSKDTDFNERSDYVTPEDEGESESRRVEYGAVGAQSNQTMLTRPQSHSNTQFFSPQNYSKLLICETPPFEEMKPQRMTHRISTPYLNSNKTSSPSLNAIRDAGCHGDDMVNIEGMARREKPLEGGNVPLCNSSSGDHASGSEEEEETEDDDHSFSAMSNSQFFDSTDFLPHKTQQKRPSAGSHKMDDGGDTSHVTATNKGGDQSFSSSSSSASMGDTETNGSIDILNTNPTLNTYSRMMFPLMEKMAGFKSENGMNNGDGFSTSEMEEDQPSLDGDQSNSSRSDGCFSVPSPPEMRHVQGVPGYNLMMTMSSASWSAEPDRAAVQLMESAPQLEVCVMDRSLCQESEFATAAFQNNSLSNQERKQMHTSQTVQHILHNMPPTSTFKEDKCTLISLGTKRHAARVKEHESNRSFELLSFKSDVYAEMPAQILRHRKQEDTKINRAHVRNVQDFQPYVNSPPMQEMHRKEISSPMAAGSINSSRSRLPVAVNRYPSGGSNLSGKGGSSPRTGSLTLNHNPPVPSNKSIKSSSASHKYHRTSSSDKRWHPSQGESTCESFDEEDLGAYIMARSRKERERDNFSPPFLSNISSLTYGASNTHHFKRQLQQQQQRFEERSSESGMDFYSSRPTTSASNRSDSGTSGGGPPSTTPSLLPSSGVSTSRRVLKQPVPSPQMSSLLHTATNSTPQAAERARNEANKHLKLTSSLKQYSKQNVFSRLYSK